MRNSNVEALKSFLEFDEDFIYSYNTHILEQIKLHIIALQRDAPFFPFGISFAFFCSVLSFLATNKAPDCNIFSVSGSGVVSLFQSIRLM